MANIKAQQAGYFNDPTTWAGGVVPGPGDNAYSNGSIVTINQSMTCSLLTNTYEPGIGAVVGGYFQTSGDNVTISANIQADIGFAFVQNVGGTVYIIGNVVAGNAVNAYGVIQGTQICSTHVVGNVTGGTGAQCYGCYLYNGTITGSCTGGSGSSAYGVVHDFVGNVTVNGNATGGPGNGLGNHGLANFSSGLTTMNGIAIAGLNCPGVGNYSVSGDMVVFGAQSSSTGQSPLLGCVKFSNTSPPSYRITKQNGSLATLVDPGDISGLVPAAGDVRNGVSYILGTRTGTLKVPPKASVANGVPTDDGVGTAALDGPTLADALLNAVLASSNPQAIRLRNSVTPQILADQLTAALNAKFD